MFEGVTLREMVKALLQKVFRMKRWKSLILGLEIGFWFVSIYILVWSFECGVRKKERRIG